MGALAPVLIPRAREKATALLHADHFWPRTLVPEHAEREMTNGVESHYLRFDLIHNQLI